MRRKLVAKMSPEALKREFWSRVNIVGDRDCWLYSSGSEHDRHQSFAKVGAHRFAYQVVHGKCPSHLHVLHTCDTPRCCNPFHLYLGTTQDNNRDRVVRNRAAKGSKNARAKLIEENVADIKQQLAAGLHVTAIAKLWDVTPMTVRRIRNGRNWAHVQPNTTTSPTGKSDG